MKLLKFFLSLMLILPFASCGDDILDNLTGSQDPDRFDNKPPEIISITSDSEDRIISPNMTIIITVEAEDPEEGVLAFSRYSFDSEYGSIL